MVPTLNGVRALLPVLYRAHTGCLCPSNTVALRLCVWLAAIRGMKTRGLSNEIAEIDEEITRGENRLEVEIEGKSAIEDLESASVEPLAWQKAQVCE
jgi:hypothetical protein